MTELSDQMESIKRKLNRRLFVAFGGIAIMAVSGVEIGAAESFPVAAKFGLLAAAGTFASFKAQFSAMDLENRLDELLGQTSLTEFSDPDPTT